MLQVELFKYTDSRTRMRVRHSCGVPTSTKDLTPFVCRQRKLARAKTSGDLVDGVTINNREVEESVGVVTRSAGMP